MIINRMRFAIVLLLSAFMVAPLSAQSLEDQSLKELKNRLESIHAELEQLAEYSLNSGTGAIGYRSRGHHENVATEWIQIDLRKAVAIDQIALIPALWRDSKKGFQADGFPLEFNIRVGLSDNDQTGTVIGEYRMEPKELERIAPLILPIDAVTAKWVRLEATQLSRRAFNHDYVLQFSEIMIFSGSQNVALNALVSAPSSLTDAHYKPWSKAFLVDGQVPYLMDAADGNESIAYLSPNGDKPALIIDLKDGYTLDQINLYEVEHNDTAPQGYAMGLGTPRHLKVEGAIEPDFADAKSLIDIHLRSPFDVGPVMMWSIPETTCRYLRISAVDDELDSLTSPFLEPDQRIGFAEVQLLSKGNNVALHAPVTLEKAREKPNSARSPEALTDGHNLYGTILPTRTWLEQLARRHDLQVQLPLVSTALNDRYTQQKTLLNRIIWLAVILTIIAVTTVIYLRSLNHREMTQMRARFAADIHDELGANLHVIGLLSDLAKSEIHKPEMIEHQLSRIRKMTDRTVKAVRHYADVLEVDDPHTDLPSDMERFTERILADIDYTLAFEGEPHFQSMRPRTKADLFLFYKEALVNVSRHSQATRCTMKLIANSKDACLTIADNGIGLAAENLEDIPPSLKRRAILLKGKATTPCDSGGTLVILNFPL